ncbi:MAG TPA: hypothetical protein VF352_00205 [Anaerolineales bacterium]
MNHTHLPRSLIILLFILVAVTFFVGTLRTFTPAHAVSNATGTPTVTLVLKTPSTTPPESESETPVSTPTATNLSQADSDENFTLTPIPEPEYVADMTGIIGLAILMVVVMLVGVAWGGRSPWKNKEPKK